MISIIDQNFGLHSWKIAKATPGMRVYVQPGMTYVDSGLSCDTFNVLHINDGAAVTSQSIINAITYYRQKGLAFCLWVCCENLTENVRTAIAALQLKQQNQEPGMVLALDQYQPVYHSGHSNAAGGNNQKLVNDYAYVVAENWTPPDQNVLEYYRQVGPVILQNSTTVQFAVYYQNQQPVSVIEVFATDNTTAGLYGLATLASYRGQGIGTSLLTFALNHCKKLGYSQVILQASDDGIGIYKKIGFEIYTEYYEFA